MNWLMLLFACWGDSAYIVEGTVVQVSAADEVILDHEAIEGLGMDAMVMPFRVRDPALIAELQPGHKVLARFEVAEDGGYLTKVRVTGKGPAPEIALPEGPEPLRVGQTLTPTLLRAEDGSTLLVGKGQDKPTALTFIYTRCPLPEFCPATVSRLQSLQEAVGSDVRLVAVTLDPEHDTPEVLEAFGRASSADPAVWRFAHAGGLDDLVLRAGMTVVRPTDGSADIVHAVRWLVLDRSGKLVQRYDDHAWPVERMVEQLRTGAPLGVGPDATP